MFRSSNHGSNNSFPYCFHNEPQLEKGVMVKYLSPIKKESWLQHAFICSLVIQVLEKRKHILHEGMNIKHEVTSILT